MGVERRVLGRTGREVTVIGRGSETITPRLLEDLGALAGKVSAMDRSPTAFQMGVNKVSWVLIRFMLVMVPLVLMINGLTKGDWTEGLLFALSVAVGLTPEMLPMIVMKIKAGPIRSISLPSRPRVSDAVRPVPAISGQNTAATAMMTENDRARRTPGMMPAMNRSPIEVSVMAP